MKTKKWIQVNDEFSRASHHFAKAAALFIQGDLTSTALDSDRAHKAFVQALLAGHTALENGLSQIMVVFNEDISAPFGPGLDLIRRACMATSRRPAILEQDTVGWVDVIQRYREVTTSCRGGSLAPCAYDLVIAARMLSQRILPGYRQFLKMPSVQPV